MNLSNLIEIVKKKFSKGTPNGWLLGWDENRFFNDLKRLADPFTCINYTSFDYSFCNLFEIQDKLVNPQSYLVLTVCVSFIVDAYSLHWTLYKNKGRWGKVVPSPTTRPEVDLESRIHAFLKKKGFFDIPGDWYNAKVEGIHLELSDDDKVIIGKCLFNDFEH